MRSRLAARAIGDDGTVADLDLTLTLDDVEVPGAWWLPSGRTEVTGTVCIGHGGFQHKRADNVVALARQLVAELGVGVVALDAPEHGDRVTDPEAHASQLAALSSRDPDRRASVIGERERAVMADRARTHVAEWRACSIVSRRRARPARSGGRGSRWARPTAPPSSVGTSASSPPSSASTPCDPTMTPGGAPPAAVTVPVMYLMQWGDELMTRDDGLALWDALGSPLETLHLNPGGHVAVPRAERDAAVAFYRRWLLP